MSKSNWCRPLGTGLICFGLLVYEILSTRLISVSIGSEIGIFAIAFAMLGMGAATSLMSLLQWPRPGADTDRFLSVSATVLGISYVVCLALLTQISEASNATLEAAMDANGLNGLIEATKETIAAKTFLIGAVLWAPFFVFGIFISVLFRSSSGSQFHTLYAADLIGAAAGCILVVIGLNYFGYSGGLALMLLTTFAGAVAVSMIDSKIRVAANAILIVGSIVFVLNSNNVALIEPQPPLNQLARNYDKQYEAKELWHTWNALSRVSLLSLEDQSSGWKTGVYAHERGTGWAAVPRLENVDPTESPVDERSFVTMFAPKRVLVLFAGVGKDMALIDRQCRGKCEIDGVEINRQMVDHALNGGVPGLRTFLSRPNITLHVAEAREFLERDSRKYDAILLSWWGAGIAHYIGSSGMLAQYMYTKEAFESLLDHLAPQGSLVIFNGNKAQVLANFRKIFAERHLGNLKNKAIILRKDTPAKTENQARQFEPVDELRLVIKPAGFSEDDLKAVRATAHSARHRILMSPDFVDPGYALYGKIVDGTAMEAINQTVLQKHEIELSIVTDDRPFIEHLVPRSYYLDLSKLTDLSTGTKPWMATRAILIFVLMLCIVAVALIVAPLLLKPGPRLSARNVMHLGYFTCLGAGFILVEIALLRKFGLILGHPSYAIAIVLAALIFSTGLGALASSRMHARYAMTSKRAAMLVAIYVIAGNTIYDQFVDVIIALPIVAKAAFVMVALFPMGFLMGQLFPLGLVRVNREDVRLVPWAWAINGTASTVFVGVADVISHPLGYNTVLYVGAAFYAGILLLPLKERRDYAIDVTKPALGTAI